MPYRLYHCAGPKRKIVAASAASTLGHLECEPALDTDSGDHRIFLANVVRGKLHHADAQPMVHVRKSGTTY